MLNKVLTIICGISISINAMEISEDLTKIPKQSVFVSHKLGDIDLYHGHDGFMVHKDGEYHKVKSCFLDKTLRNVKKKHLDVLQRVGKFELKKFNNSEEYTLKIAHKGKGGGPGLASFCYWMTKGLGYGIPTMLATGAVVATLPVTAGPGAMAGLTTLSTGGANVMGGMAVSNLMGATLTTGVAASSSTVTASVLASKAIIATVGTQAATQATVSVVGASSIGGTGYVALIEGLATGIWAWAMALPTP